MVIYQERGKGYSKYSHHLEPGCSPYTGERFFVNTKTHRIEYFINCLDTLKKVKEDWALEEIARIAKIDVSSDMLGDIPVESHALAYFRTKLEEGNEEYNQHITPVIRDISKHAVKQNVRAEALILLEEYNKLI